MVTINARKRIESIEKDVIPAMFVGVLSKDDAWLKHTLVETLPMLEARALRLAETCKKNGECWADDTLCDKERISKMFKDTRKKLENENLARKAHSRYHH